MFWSFYLNRLNKNKPLEGRGRVPPAPSSRWYPHPLRSGGAQGSRGKTLLAFPSPGPGVASFSLLHSGWFGLPSGAAAVCRDLLIGWHAVFQLRGTQLAVAAAAAAWLPLGPRFAKSGFGLLCCCCCCLLSPHLQGHVAGLRRLSGTGRQARGKPPTYRLPRTAVRCKTPCIDR